MLIEKTGLLSRVRTVLTVFVMLIGLGSTLMAMKPADKNAAFTYGVAITSHGTNYKVVRDVNNMSPDDWECDALQTACLIQSPDAIPINTLVPTQDALVKTQGKFIAYN